MSRPTADNAVGMMDSAYFVGRRELLEFLNDLLQLNLSKIEQTASGAIACQLADMIYPGSIPMNKVNWSAKVDFEFVQNYKLLQTVFNKKRVQRHVDVQKLIRAKHQDNLEFMQWFKAFYEQSGSVKDDYDPIAQRERGKGGKEYNKTMARKRGTTAPAKPRPRNTTTTAQPKTTATTATNNNAKPVNNNNNNNPAADRFSRPLRERTSATNPQAQVVVATNADLSSPTKQTTTTSTKVVSEEDEIERLELMQKNEELIQKNEILIDENEKLKDDILAVETERDGYYEKLRNIEIMLQVHQEKGIEESDVNHVIENIFKVLYADMQEQLIVSEDGELLDESDVIVNNELSLAADSV